MQKKEKELIFVTNTTHFTVCIDSDIKKQCEAMYGELGIDLNTAINVFLRQSLRVGGFPFDVRLKQPNKETICKTRFCAKKRRQAKQQGKGKS